MSRIKWTVGLCVLSLVIPAAIADDHENGWSYDENLAFRSQDNRFQLDIVNYFHGLGAYQNPDSPDTDTGRSFDVSNLRVKLSGKALDRWRFTLQADLSDGSLSDNEDDSDLLLDAFVVYERNPGVQLWLGQGKVAFGRQFQTDEFHQQFIDRSIATRRFAHGRDVGIAVIGANSRETYNYGVGIYNGNGINEARDENKDYLIAARLGITPMGRMPTTESDPDWRDNPEARLAIGVSALTNKLGAGGFEEERINRGNLEVSYRVRGLAINGEFFTESRDAVMTVPADEADTDGWYIQAGYTFPVSEIGMMELAARYSEILRDIVDRDEIEAGVVATLFVRGQRTKIQVDYRQLEFEGPQAGDRIDRDEARALLQMIF